jgi:hypothetical protein
MTQENCCTPVGQIKRYVDCKGCDKKPKQETLEEAAENYVNRKGSIPTTELEDAIFKQGFLDGAKWQADRMYSEEEVIEILTQRSKEFGTKNEKFQKLLLKQDLEWFEQFKKR